MHLRPILSTLRRHRTAALLIVIEIAVTCAIVSNTLFVIRERLARANRPTGIAEDELTRIRIAQTRKTDAVAATQQDLIALRAIPGVRFATATNQTPLGKSSWNNDLRTSEDAPNAISTAMYLGGPDLVETLGVQLVAGRDFERNEYVSFDDAQVRRAPISSVILTRGLAAKMFPDRDPLGAKVYGLGSTPQVVVGVVDELARPNEFGGPDGAELSVIYPIDVPYTVSGTYLLRVDPGRARAILDEATAALDRVEANRVIIGRETFGEIRHAYFKEDRAMAYMLIAVSIALLVITAFGIVGLASFWVQQRTRHIGIRRALGATRTDIVRYFQIENFLLATAGIVLGMVMAYAINLWLMDAFGVARLPATVLPIGALLLWTLGQVAVLAPARRAARIPPALATRSV
jgi:putative ABC transport system permease protein